MRHGQARATNRTVAATITRWGCSFPLQCLLIFLFTPLAIAPFVSHAAARGPNTQHLGARTSTHPYNCLGLRLLRGRLLVAQGGCSCCARRLPQIGMHTLINCWRRLLPAPIVTRPHTFCLPTHAHGMVPTRVHNLCSQYGLTESESDDSKRHVLFWPTSALGSWQLAVPWSRGASARRGAAGARKPNFTIMKADQPRRAPKDRFMLYSQHTRQNSLSR